MDNKLRDLMRDRRVELEKARETLKLEFFGIDKVIDEIIDSIGSWFLLPEFQERPLVVNLWGLTGVGKTSLVQKLVELIGFEKKFYRFNLGDNEISDYSIKTNMKSIYERDKGAPAILAFDEFQHSRTIDSNGTENEKTGCRIIWEILDRGGFQLSFFSSESLKLYYWTSRLTTMLERGVRVKEGRVVYKKELFVKEMGNVSLYYMRGLTKKGEVFFVPDEMFELILPIIKTECCSEYELRSKFSRMDGPETIHFLNHILEIGNKPKFVDCSKMLVFVIGNLDEAYKMTGNMNADSDADLLYKESLRITISHIKNALKNQFRAEQIARLGNLHIIYPSLNRKAFETIIAIELKRISMKFEESLNIKLNFDDSVRELCYNEGVYPTQGTRPVFATIQQLIVSRLGSISETSSLTNQNVDEIILSYKNDKICVECFRRRNQVKSFILPLKLTLQSLRKSKMDELQAVVAVHESGHAVAYIILFGRIPNSIHSVTADSEHQGFVDGEHDDKFITKSQLVKAIAVHLAGITAEEIVFGKENITNGASTDIETATKMAADLVKSSGFGKEKMFIRPENIQTSLSVYDRNGEINEEIKTIVREGYELAKTTLLCEEWLLVQLSNHLSRNSVIYRDEIMLFVEKFGVTKNRATSETMGNNYSYRVTLSERVRGTKQMNK